MQRDTDPRALRWPRQWVPAGALALLLSACLGGVVLPAQARADNGTATAPATGHGYVAEAPATPVVNPEISAATSAAAPPKGSRWFRTPVRVAFACTARSAPLTEPCPPSLVLRNQRRTTIRRTITATDGGSASITITTPRVDTTGPRVEVIGVRDGATYSRARVPRCRATDALSGLADRCRVTTHRTRHGSTTVVRYRAHASDKARNTTVRRGSFRVTRGGRVHG